MQLDAVLGFKISCIHLAKLHSVEFSVVVVFFYIKTAITFTLLVMKKGLPLKFKHTTKMQNLMLYESRMALAFCINRRRA